MHDLVREPINQYDARDDEPDDDFIREYDRQRRKENEALVKGGQGRGIEEVTSNALQGAVMGILWIAIIFVVCLKGCF